MTDHSDESQDAEVLFPDREVSVGGETVTVREFRFGELGRVTPIARPLLDALGAIAGGVDPADDLGLWESIVAEHHDACVELIAISTGRPASWVRGLIDGDGQALMMTFWAVNASFFLRRLVSRELQRRAAGRSASSTSSRPSSAPDTAETPPTSPTA